MIIITSQGDRSAKQRRLVRRTWLKQIQTEFQPARIAAKFFVGRHSEAQVLTDAVAAEMLKHGDNHPPLNYAGRMVSLVFPS